MSSDPFHPPTQPTPLSTVVTLDIRTPTNTISNLVATLECPLDAPLCHVRDELLKLSPGSRPAQSWKPSALPSLEQVAASLPRGVTLADRSAQMQRVAPANMSERAESLGAMQFHAFDFSMPFSFCQNGGVVNVRGTKEPTLRVADILPIMSPTCGRPAENMLIRTTGRLVYSQLPRTALRSKRMPDSIKKIMAANRQKAPVQREQVIVPRLPVLFVRHGGRGMEGMHSEHVVMDRILLSEALGVYGTAPPPRQLAAIINLHTANVKDFLSRTVLSEATQTGNAALVAYLTSLPYVDLEARDWRGQTALHIAAEKDDAACARLLLRAHASIEARDAVGQTPMHIALLNRSDSVTNLIEARAVDDGLLPERIAEITDIYDMSPADCFRTSAPMSFRELCSDGGELDDVRAMYSSVFFDRSVVTERDMFGQVALHAAAAGGREPIISFLLDVAKVPVANGCVDSRGRTPLHIACERGHTAAALRLLRVSTISPGGQDRNARTPLVCALRARQSETAVALLGAAPPGSLSVDAVDCTGASALDLAAYNGDEAAVKLLLQVHKASPSHCEKEFHRRLRPLRRRGGKGVILSAAAMAAAAAPVEKKISVPSYPPLWYAVCAPHARGMVVAELLLAGGALEGGTGDDVLRDIVWRSLTGNLLHVATRVSAALRVGLGVDDVLLHRAVRAKHHDAVRWLVQQGRAGLDVPEAKSGMTPLSLAIEAGDMETIKFLLSSGASPNKGGVTPVLTAEELESNYTRHVEPVVAPLLLAIRLGSDAAVPLLVGAGANVLPPKGEDGHLQSQSLAESPCHLALSRGMVDVFKGLLGQGAGVNEVVPGKPPPREHLTGKSGSRLVDNRRFILPAEAPTPADPLHTFLSTAIAAAPYARDIAPGMFRARCRHVRRRVTRLPIQQTGEDVLPTMEWPYMSKGSAAVRAKVKAFDDLIVFLCQCGVDIVTGTDLPTRPATRRPGAAPVDYAPAANRKGRMEHPMLLISLAASKGLWAGCSAMAELLYVMWPGGVIGAWPTPPACPPLKDGELVGVSADRAREIALERAVQYSRDSHVGRDAISFAAETGRSALILQLLQLGYEPRRGVGSEDIDVETNAYTSLDYAIASDDAMSTVLLTIVGLYPRCRHAPKNRIVRDIYLAFTRLVCEPLDTDRHLVFKSDTKKLPSARLLPSKIRLTSWIPHELAAAGATEALEMMLTVSDRIPRHPSNMVVLCGVLGPPRSGIAPSSASVPPDPANPFAAAGTLVYHAARAGSVDIIKLLLGKYCVRVIAPPGALNPVTLAVLHNDLNTAASLAAAGGDGAVCALGALGDVGAQLCAAGKIPPLLAGDVSALCVAAYRLNAGLVSLLLSKGGANAGGASPLLAVLGAAPVRPVPGSIGASASRHVASQTARADAAERIAVMLIKAGCAMASAAPNGDLPINIAARKGFWSVVREMLGLPTTPAQVSHVTMPTAAELSRVGHLADGGEPALPTSAAASGRPDDDGTSARLDTERYVARAREAGVVAGVEYGGMPFREYEPAGGPKDVPRIVTVLHAAAAEGACDVIDVIIAVCGHAGTGGDISRTAPVRTTSADIAAQSCKPAALARLLAAGVALGPRRMVALSGSKVGPLSALGRAKSSHRDIWCKSRAPRVLDDRAEGRCSRRSLAPTTFSRRSGTASTDAQLAMQYVAAARAIAAVSRSGGSFAPDGDAADGSAELAGRPGASAYLHVAAARGWAAIAVQLLRLGVSAFGSLRMPAFSAQTATLPISPLWMAAQSRSTDTAAVVVLHGGAGGADSMRCVLHPLIAALVVSVQRSDSCSAASRVRGTATRCEPMGAVMLRDAWGVNTSPLDTSAGMVRKLVEAIAVQQISVNAVDDVHPAAIRASLPPPLRHVVPLDAPVTLGRNLVALRATPFFLACVIGDVSLMSCLYGAGADVFSADSVVIPRRRTEAVRMRRHRLKPKAPKEVTERKKKAGYHHRKSTCAHRNRASELPEGTAVNVKQDAAVMREFVTSGPFAAPPLLGVMLAAPWLAVPRSSAPKGSDRPATAPSSSYSGRETALGARFVAALNWLVVHGALSATSPDVLSLCVLIACAKGLWEAAALLLRDAPAGAPVTVDSTAVSKGGDVHALDAPPNEFVSNLIVEDDVGRFLREAVPSAVLTGAGINAVHAVHIAATAATGDLFDMFVRRSKREDVSALPDASGYTAFHLAARSGNAAAIGTLAAIGCDVDIRGGPRESTPLHLAAAYSGSVSTVDALVRAGAQLNAVDSTGCTALMRAAESGSVEVLQSLLAHGADPHVVSAAGMNALMMAALNGHDAVALPLLQFWVRHDSLATPVTTVLHCAAASGCLPVVEFVLRAMEGVRLFERDSFGATPIGLAYASGSAAVKHALLVHLSAHPEEGDDPLLSPSASRPVFGWFRDMLTVNAVPQRQGPDATLSVVGEATVAPSGGATLAETQNLLHWAASNGSATAARVLGDHCIIDDCGALHAAAERGHMEVVEMLLALDMASLSATDEEGSTALHRAVLARREREALLLLSKCSTKRMMKADSLGRNVLHLACISGAGEVVQHVLSHHALLASKRLAASDINPEAPATDGAPTDSRVLEHVERLVSIRDNAEHTAFEYGILCGHPMLSLRIAVAVGGGAVPSTLPAASTFLETVACMPPAARVLLYDVWGMTEASRTAFSLPPPPPSDDERDGDGDLNPSKKKRRRRQLHSRLSFADVRAIGLERLRCDRWAWGKLQHVVQSVDHERSVYRELMATARYSHRMRFAFDSLDPLAARRKLLLLQRLGTSCMFGAFARSSYGILPPDAPLTAVDIEYVGNPRAAGVSLDTNGALRMRFALTADNSALSCGPVDPATALEVAIRPTERAQRGAAEAAVRKLNAFIRNECPGPLNSLIRQLKVSIDWHSFGSLDSPSGAVSEADVDAMRAREALFSCLMSTRGLPDLRTFIETKLRFDPKLCPDVPPPPPHPFTSVVIRRSPWVKGVPFCTSSSSGADSSQLDILVDVVNGADFHITPFATVFAPVVERIAAEHTVAAILSSRVAFQQRVAAIMGTEVKFRVESEDGSTVTDSAFADVTSSILAVLTEISDGGVQPDPPPPDAHPLDAVRPGILIASGMRAHLTGIGIFISGSRSASVGWSSGKLVITMYSGADTVGIPSEAEIRSVVTSAVVSAELRRLRARCADLARDVATKLRPLLDNDSVPSPLTVSWEVFDSLSDDEALRALGVLALEDSAYAMQPILPALQIGWDSRLGSVVRRHVTHVVVTVERGPTSHMALDMKGRLVYHAALLADPEPAARYGYHPVRSPLYTVHEMASEMLRILLARDKSVLEAVDVDRAFPTCCRLAGPHVSSAPLAQECFFYVSARNILDRRCKVGGEMFDVSLTPVSRGAPDVKAVVGDASNGRYKVMFTTPAMLATYRVDVALRGTSLVGCPYALRVLCGKAVPSGARVLRHPGVVTVGQKAELILHMHDAIGNPVRTSQPHIIWDVQANADDVRARDCGDGSLCVSFMPVRDPGVSSVQPVRLHVAGNGVPVEGSVFTFNVNLPA